MPEIDYHFTCTPYSVNDGVTVPYFVNKRFNTAVLVVPDTGIYANEINKLKAAGLRVIVDIEQPIWAGGQQQNTPISNFATYFQNLKNVGVTIVSSEGGRSGDLDVISKYFAYMNYNCDQCGLWKDFYKHPATVINSWEAYYPWEWEYIQKGIIESKGKKQGILAGLWEGGANPILTATKSGNGLSYYQIANWMLANGGVDHFSVWGGLNNESLAQYKVLGFEAIVNKMQAMLPPRTSSPIIPTPKPALGNPISVLTAQYTKTATGNIIDGRGRDKDNKPATGRMTGLWEQNLKTKDWFGVSWRAIDGEAYYAYNLDKLLPSGYHKLRIQTNDGVTTDITPYEKA
jgi:hypothetical protein